MEQEMRYVYEVYKCRSFSKAADSLYITQPALSIAVQKIEKRLGMPLFDRTAKPLQLTAAGELYIKKIEEIQNLEMELSQQINDLSSLKTGTIRIGGSHYFNSYILPPVLTEYTKKYPGIHIELMEAGSDQLLNMLYEHTIDVTFNCSLHPKDSFIRKHCFIDTILLAVPKEYSINASLQEFAFTSEDILQKKHQFFEAPSPSITKFEHTPFILLTSGNNLYSRSEIFFKEAGIAPKVCLQVSQLVTAWHLAQAGMGATFISDRLVTPGANTVVYYRINAKEAIRIFDLVMSDRHYISNAMKKFEETFRNYYGI